MVYNYYGIAFETKKATIFELSLHERPYTVK